MAVLNDTDRRELWAEFMRVDDNLRGVALTKADLRAVFDAADDWADANAAGFNTALPQPGRGALTAKQKTLILAHVILKRAGLL